MSASIGLAVFGFIGVAALLLLFVPLRKTLRYFTWKHVPATLLSAEVAYETVGRYPMSGRMVATFGYVPKISYKYHVGNDQYESRSIVDPLEEIVWFSTQAKADRFMESMIADGTMGAFYDPRNPCKSVLLNQPRVTDLVGIVAGCVISTLCFYLAIALWPDRVPELDFPLYENAEIYAYPDKDDLPKYWTLTSADALDDVTAFYDDKVGKGWESSQDWQPGLGGSVFRVWVRETTDSGGREVVTVRVQKETNFVRKGLEVSVGYRDKPLDVRSDVIDR